MIPEKEYEKIILRLCRDRKNATRILDNMNKDIQLLWEDFYGSKDGHNTHDSH